MPRKPVAKKPIPTVSVSFQLPLSLVGKLIQRMHRLNALPRPATLSSCMRVALEDLVVEEWLPSDDLSLIEDIFTRAGVPLPSRIEMRRPVSQPYRRRVRNDF